MPRHSEQADVANVPAHRATRPESARNTFRSDGSSFWRACRRSGFSLSLLRCPVGDPALTAAAPSRPRRLFASARRRSRLTPLSCFPAPFRRGKPAKPLKLPPTMSEKGDVEVSPLLSKAGSGAPGTEPGEHETGVAGAAAAAAEKSSAASDVDAAAMEHSVENVQVASEDNTSKFQQEVRKPTKGLCEGRGTAGLRRACVGKVRVAYKLTRLIWLDPDQVILGLLRKMVGVKDIVGMRISLPAQLLDPMCVSGLRPSRLWCCLFDEKAVVDDSGPALDQILNTGIVRCPWVRFMTALAQER
ncbi:MAG: hypothetical protein BJ554DRAFT_2394 [Olpidium bornovanus]|uniref:Uncharacterized protein n=1 Tax=Olpidium bornovanus TaxID=278681 RepID=A0A8H7ZQW6_9FUNG|nr:MAG: hypothetical protein BJ554DRAFT_2394 [Olpidium bornovanus]